MRRQNKRNAWGKDGERGKREKTVMAEYHGS
jgi:hypothetical protein